MFREHTNYVNVKVRGCALAQSQRSELDRRVRRFSVQRHIFSFFLLGRRAALHFDHMRPIQENSFGLHAMSCDLGQSAVRVRQRLGHRLPKSIPGKLSNRLALLG